MQNFLQMLADQLGQKEEGISGIKGTFSRYTQLRGILSTEGCEIRKSLVSAYFG